MPKMPKMMPEQQVIESPATKMAGAGRGRINPRPVNVPEEDYVSPSDRMAMEEQIREMREMRDAEKAFNRSMRSTGMKKGGSVSTASKRADGCAERGLTRGKMV